MTQMTLPFFSHIVLFQTPIIAGREPDATDLQRTLSAEQSNVLSETVNLVWLSRSRSVKQGRFC